MISKTYLRYIWLLDTISKARFPLTYEGTEKLKPTIKLKVDDGETAVLPFIICLF